MKIPCKHWEDCGLDGGGCCAKGLYKGKPSLGVCLRHCNEYVGPARPPLFKQLQASVGGCCPPARRYRWGGIIWLGVPKPIRKQGKKYEGCGCIAVLYNLRATWRQWKAMNKRDRDALVRRETRDVASTKPQDS